MRFNKEFNWYSLELPCSANALHLVLSVIIKGFFQFFKDWYYSHFLVKGFSYFVWFNLVIHFRMELHFDQRAALFTDLLIVRFSFNFRSHFSLIWERQYLLACAHSAFCKTVGAFGVIMVIIIIVSFRNLESVCIVNFHIGN